ncbi:hypothetical protein [Vibrio quintilis]|uniref:Uncharacterized protein n=1 Tax=Vibrio quintilis TaxID=1117707 RepID=A0A1M7YR12_9VIBR|nr:hypothetical protein [Vibrio quintilis]SHO55015.1 hypothetical protein VQ7734_00734 [Vibrio quintilis]
MNTPEIDRNLSWKQLHEYSNYLILENPDTIIDAGASLLAILQECFLCADMAGRKDHLPTDEFLSCLQMAEGMVRMGNQILRPEGK